MSLHRIHGIDRRNTPTDLAPVGEAATDPARHPGGPGRMSLHRIRGIDHRSTPTDLVLVGEAATGPARHPGGPGRMSLLRIRGLDRPRRAGRTPWHVDREV